MNFSKGDLDREIIPTIERAVKEAADPATQRNFTRLSLVAELCMIFCTERRGSAEECVEYRKALEQRFVELAGEGKITLDFQLGKVGFPLPAPE